MLNAVLAWSGGTKDPMSEYEEERIGALNIACKKIRTTMRGSPDANGSKARQRPERVNEMINSLMGLRISVSRPIKKRTHMPVMPHNERTIPAVVSA